MPSTNWIHTTRLVLLALILLACQLSPVRADKAADDFNVAVNLYRTQRYDTASE
ncbi:MAG: hypothetical protein RL215_2096, partial [Planctomycetota bacterium]